MRKDYKSITEEKKEGLQSEQYGVKVAVNQKLSHVSRRNSSQCLSSKCGKDSVPVVVGSANVKALYPSLDIEFAIDKACELFLESNLEIEGVRKELGLYLVLNR